MKKKTGHISIFKNVVFFLFLKLTKGLRCSNSINVSVCLGENELFRTSLPHVVSLLKLRAHYISHCVYGNRAAADLVNTISVTLT